MQKQRLASRDGKVWLRACVACVCLGVLIVLPSLLRAETFVGVPYLAPVELQPVSSLPLFAGGLKVPEDITTILGPATEDHGGVAL